MTSTNETPKNNSHAPLSGVIARCHSCGNEVDTKIQGTEPIGTKVVVTNYCPNCEDEHSGDFWEHMWCEDGKGNVL